MTTDSDAVTNLIVDQAKKLKPWAMPWWVALIQGLLAGGLGLLFVLRPGEFTNVILQFLALFLLILGLLDTVGGLVRERATTAANLTFYRGLVGFLGGLILISLIFLGFFDTAARANLGQNLLAIVTIAYGAIGLVLVFMRQATQGKMVALVGAAIFVLLGIAFLIPSIGTLLQAWFGPTLLLLGLALIVLAFVRRSQVTTDVQGSPAL